MRLKRALLVVDIQNDFCPGGALGIKDGDTIIAAVNRYIKIFGEAKLPVFISRDWHPKETAHFKEFGGVWPAHCVQNTKGSRFHPKLRLPKDSIIISKGMNRGEDSYSAFQAVDAQGHDLLILLKMFRIEEIFICGLAADYCVKWTAFDALKNGLRVNVLTDAIKGVNLRPRGSEEAMAEMSSRGARMLKWRDVARSLSIRGKKG